jgi:hypothetical protein
MRGDRRRRFIWPLILLLGAGLAHVAGARSAAVLNADSFKHYIERFNADDDELYRQSIPNADAWGFLSANMPLFECPDPDLERIYYFRWWTYRKHINLTPEGYVITEFLPKMPWGGKYNEINAAAPLHFDEGRWLRDQRILDDYGHYWFRGSGRARNRLYSFWPAHSLYSRYLVTGDSSQVIDLLPDLVANYRAWEDTRRDTNGLFWQLDVSDAMEESISGHGYRPTINSQMFGEANAIAAIATLAGKPDIACTFQQQAAQLKKLVQEKLWDSESRFFKVAPRLDVLPLRSAGILKWKVNNDSALTASARVSASHQGEGDSLEALKDGCEPGASNDPTIPRMMFGGRSGTTEWVQYDFPGPIHASSVQVYWCRDDRNCRLPKQWRVFYRDGDEWRAVKHLKFYPAQADRFNNVPFERVRTTGLRVEVTSQGVQGWKPGYPLPLADVRELHGYTPWFFNLPDLEFTVAWKQLMDPRGFFAPFGPTTAEQQHSGFKLDYEGHPCQWNGPSWPFATATTLAALGNVLNGPDQHFVHKADYLTLLRNYARSHQLRREDGRTVAWIDENLNPFTGEWLVRTKLQRRGARPVERGKDYNHSTYCDLIISGLVGLRPRSDDVLEVNPLIPPGTWDYFCLDGVPYHGRTLTILWDHDGSKYGRGQGLRIYADGDELAASSELRRVQVRFSGKPQGRPSSDSNALPIRPEDQLPHQTLPANYQP